MHNQLYYFHYFYSPLSGKGFPAGEGSIELLGIDRRDESNIDELHRLGMSMGQRIAQEIKIAIEKNMLEKVVY